MKALERSRALEENRPWCKSWTDLSSHPASFVQQIVSNFTYSFNNSKEHTNKAPGLTGLTFKCREASTTHLSTVRKTENIVTAKIIIQGVSKAITTHSICSKPWSGIKVEISRSFERIKRTNPLPLCFITVKEPTVKNQISWPPGHFLKKSIILTDTT